MFFIISKIVWIVLSPLNLVFLVLGAGSVTSFFFRTAGRSLLILGMFLLVAGGILPLGKNALIPLENFYVRPAVLPDHIDGILVLGGSFMTDISQKRGAISFNETGERITEALSLAHQYPQAVLVFSGGNGHLLAGQGARTEAEDTALFLSHIGFDNSNVIYEDESRNTYENIKLSKELILPQSGETWILITSAWHMPRAMALAHAQGWGNVIPWPVDYRTDGAYGWLPEDFDMLGSFYNLHVALHEYFGIMAYQATGKIALPFPQPVLR